MTAFRILLHICLSTTPSECMAGWESGDCGVRVNQKCVVTTLSTCAMHAFYNRCSNCILIRQSYTALRLKKSLCCSFICPFNTFVLKSISNQLPFFVGDFVHFSSFPTRESQLNHAKPISRWIDTCPRSLYKSTRNVKKWMSIQGNGWAPHLVHFPWCMTHGMLGGAPAPPWPWVTRAGVGNGWIICVPVIDGMG